jgi:hypothetical protein
MTTKQTDYMFTDEEGNKLAEFSAANTAIAIQSFLGSLDKVEKLIAELKIQRHTIRIYHRTKTGRWMLVR